MEPTQLTTITVSEYEQLTKDQFWLQCLEQAGVDNWKGYDIAREIFREYDEE
jgi:hypothetical protein